MKLQDLSQNTGGQKVIILSNLLLRFGQLVTGVVTIILYSQENGYWLNKGIPRKISYEFAVGALAILTAIGLGLIPLMLSYRPVAFAAPWDMIMFFLYSAAFGVMRDFFYHDLNSNGLATSDTTRNSKEYGNHLATHWENMRNICWVDLAGMLLFLTSAVMGAMLVWIGHRSSRRGASIV